MQIKFKQLLYKISLDHVSAHKGIEGNECADQLTKQVTTAVDHHISKPTSCIKTVLKSRILTEFQDYWDTTDNVRHTHDLIPKVSYKLYTLIPFTTNYFYGPWAL